MEGLEATEKKLSELERSWRIDAEFFQSRYLDIDRKLATLRCESVAHVADVSDGNHFSISASFVDDGIPYYRGQDVVGHFFIEQATPNTITRDAFEQSFMQRSHLKKGDVLLSIIGTVGETSLVKTQREATCSCKLAILRPKSIQPAYLAAYLSSDVGRSLTARWKRGAVQTGLLLEDMDQLAVPRFSKPFEERVTHMVDMAYQALEDGRRSIADAESALLQALGLDTWQPPEALTYVRRSRDAFDAGRLDAEHFQDAYYALHRILTNQVTGYRSIGELASSLTNGVEIREYVRDGTPYLRVGDIKNFTVDENSVIRVDPALAEKEIGKVSLEVGDVLVSRSGSLAVTAVVEPEWAHSLISSHLIRVRIADKSFDPYYVALFLAGLPGKMQITQWSNGGVQPEISQPSLSRVVVPYISERDQSVIRLAMINARNAREQAGQFLSFARRAIEIAIETTEETALDYLSQTNKMLHAGGP